MGYGMLLAVDIISRCINTWNLLQGFQLSKLYGSFFFQLLFHIFILSLLCCRLCFKLCFVNEGFGMGSSVISNLNIL